VGSNPPTGEQFNHRLLLAMLLNFQPAAVKTAHSLTAVNSVVPTIVPSTAPAKGSLAQ